MGMRDKSLFYKASAKISFLSIVPTTNQAVWFKV